MSREAVDLFDQARPRELVMTWMGCRSGGAEAELGGELMPRENSDGMEIDFLLVTVRNTQS